MLVQIRQEEWWPVLEVELEGQVAWRRFEPVELPAQLVHDYRRAFEEFERVQGELRRYA